MRAFWWLRVRFKTWLARYWVVIEFCHTCGRENEGWYVTEWFWFSVTGELDGEGAPTCLSCFANRSAAKGLYPVFSVDVRNIPHPSNHILRWEKARMRKQETRRRLKEAK